MLRLWQEADVTPPSVTDSIKGLRCLIAEPSPILHTPSADAKTWPIPGTPIAAFAPDDTLVALVTNDSGCLRSLAVFIS